MNPSETIIQAVWTNFKDYDEILISPTMVRDHMPDRMLKAMKNLLESSGKVKQMRRRQSSDAQMHRGSGASSGRSSSTQSNTPSRCQHVETSFANAFDQTANNLEQRFTNLNEDRLRRLRSLVRRGRAPLAEDESWSLEDGSTEPDVENEDSQDKGNDFRADGGSLSQQAHPTSIIIDLTTNDSEFGNTLS